MRLTRAAYDECAAALVSYSEHKTAGCVARCLMQALAVITEHEGQVVGVVGLDHSDIWAYSADPVLWDMMFYVLPEHRASRAASLLRDAAIAIAEDIGAPLFMGISSGADLERKDSFFTRAGFVRVGNVYRWG